MYAFRVVRPAIALLAIALITNCSGSGGGVSGGQHVGSAPVLPNTNGHTLHAKSFGVCSPCNEYPDGTIAIADGVAGHIDLYEGPISSGTTASAVLSPSWGTNIAGMTFDPSGDLWVTAGNAVYEYSAPITTGESPSVAISGANTTLSSAAGISYNQSTGDIYVVQTGAILEWSATASGNVAPSTTVSSAAIGRGDIKTDANDIYVADASSGIDVFSLAASGSTSPGLTILSGTQYAHFDFDVEGNIYPATSGTSTIVGTYLYGNGWSYFSSFSGGSSSTILFPNVDDSGHVYVTAQVEAGGVNGNLYITNYSGGSPIVTMAGPSHYNTATALYSPGKFNGDEPQ